MSEHTGSGSANGQRQPGALSAPTHTKKKVRARGGRRLSEPVVHRTSALERLDARFDRGADDDQCDERAAPLRALRRARLGGT